MSLPLTQISIVPREPISSNDHFVQMSKQLFLQLQLKKDRELKLSLGKKIITMEVQTMDMASNEIHLPENILKEFCLPSQIHKMQAKFEPEFDTLLFGPIIALLTDFHFNDGEEPYFRSVHTFCEELHHGISENGGFFYVFSYKDFPAQGYHFDNEKWTPSELPLPDVVYNRIHSRKLEQMNPYKNFRKRLEQCNIPIFNDRFLSKWEVYEHLIQEERLHSYIPDTKIFSKENLEEAVQKYETIFIKPIHGSQGKNIIKLTKEENLYFYQTSLKVSSNNEVKKFTLDEVYQQIKSLQGNRIYILQQGISLLTYESCAMDFRALCHKNSKNLWDVTSLVARISHQEEFVSNIAKGGTIMRPLKAICQCMDKSRAGELLARMKELSIETASIISRHSPGITGELGIDIGVDKDGKLWLIEVNSKPSKKFDNFQGEIRPSAKAIIRFCTKLAFDTNTEKEEL